MIRKIDAYLFGDVSLARLYLLAKVFLAILALDCLVDLVPHGGRYGVGGFNVAHFPILDALLPLPSPAIYVGALVLVALLGLVLVFGRLRRSLRIALTVVYTLAWAGSLLDAYQHHYLISLLLASMCAFPEPPPSAPRASSSAAPGYVSFLVTIAIVYAFATLAKLEPDFRNGHALERIAPEGSFDIALALFARLGVDTAEAYAIVARATIVLEALLVVATLLAATIDRGDRRRRWAISALGIAPIGFHLAIESLDLGIGWFGRFMIAIHVVAFAPRELVEWLGGVLVRLGERLAIEPRDRFARGVLGAIAFLFAGVVLARFDLPGAIGAGIVASVLGLGTLLVDAHRGDRTSTTELPLALAVAALVSYFAIAHPRIAVPYGDNEYGLEASFVRYDYYRFVGGDATRRGALSAAIAAYSKAQVYAPNDELREQTARKIARLRRAH